MERQRYELRRRSCALPQLHLRGRDRIRRPAASDADCRLASSSSRHQEDANLNLEVVAALRIFRINGAAAEKQNGFFSRNLLLCDNDDLPRLVLDKHEGNLLKTKDAVFSCRPDLRRDHIDFSALHDTQRHRLPDSSGHKRGRAIPAKAACVLSNVAAALSAMAPLLRPEVPRVLRAIWVAVPRGLAARVADSRFDLDLQRIVPRREVLGHIEHKPQMHIVCLADFGAVESHRRRSVDAVEDQLAPALAATGAARRGGELRGVDVGISGGRYVDVELVAAKLWVGRHAGREQRALHRPWHGCQHRRLSATAATALDGGRFPQLPRAAVQRDGGAIGAQQQERVEQQRSQHRGAGHPAAAVSTGHGHSIHIKNAL